MGRGRRICYPGAFFHCLNRSNRREKIFCDEDDYDQMLKCVGKASERYGVLIHGFCLIPNHFHILLQQQEQPVSSAMRSLGTNYAAYFNRKYHKVGHVFQGRFRGILFDKQKYLLSLIRYLHLNPVRAGLVDKPQDWSWSSLECIDRSLIQPTMPTLFFFRWHNRLSQIPQNPELRLRPICPTSFAKLRKYFSC
jgi:REP element-mobilizing transposase RayT